MKSVLRQNMFRCLFKPNVLTTRFMLCNNEQFTSATTILNVFIVNMIWSEVPNRRKASICAFKRSWLNGTHTHIQATMLQGKWCTAVATQSTSLFSLIAHVESFIHRYLSVVTWCAYKGTTPLLFGKVKSRCLCFLFFRSRLLVRSHAHLFCSLARFRWLCIYEM